MGDKKPPKSGFTPLSDLPAPEFPKTGRTGDAMTKKANPVGRPTSYRAEFCEAIQRHAAIIAEGGTDSAIAEALSVDIATVYRWKNEHPEFSEACQAVKACVDDRVEASLFKRGIGYSHKAVKIFMPAGAAEPVYADYTEHYPPDTAAASLWLRNRRPKEWRDRVEHTGADGKDLPAPTTIDIMELARQMALGLEIARRRVTEAGDGGKVINQEGEEEKPK